MYVSAMTLFNSYELWEVVALCVVTVSIEQGKNHS